MATRRDDYFLRFIDQLRQLVAEAVARRDPGKLSEALLSAVAAQEKLFGRPVAEVMGLAVEEQLRLLAQGESAGSARTKKLAYAALLKETGLVYRARDMDNLAISAFQMALHVTLIVTAESADSDEDLTPTIVDLAALVPEDKLHAPVRELLEQVLA